MAFDPKVHGRRSIRLPLHDYSLDGAYFLTLVSHERRCLFGSVEDNQVLLTALGCVVRDQWIATAAIRQEITLDEFVVMPNHMHAIVWVSDRRSDFEQDVANTTGPARGPKLRSVGALVGGFKSAVTRQASRAHITRSIWQRNYFERVIRSDGELNAVRAYIVENPERWMDDQENPDATRGATAGRLYKLPFLKRACS